MTAECLIKADSVHSKVASKSGQAGGEGRTHTALRASLPGWQLAGKAPKATCVSFQKPAPPEQPGHKRQHTRRCQRQARRSALSPPGPPAALGAERAGAASHKPNCFSASHPRRPTVPRGTLLLPRPHLACPEPSTNICCWLPRVKKHDWDWAWAKHSHSQALTSTVYLGKRRGLTSKWPLSFIYSRQPGLGAVATSPVQTCAKSLSKHAIKIRQEPL